MSGTRRSPQSVRRRAIRRRRLSALATLAVAATFVGLAIGSSESPKRAGKSASAPGVVTIARNGKTILRADARRLALWSGARLERWLAVVPDRRRQTRGRVRLEMATDRKRLERQVMAAARSGGAKVEVPETTVRAEVRLAVVKQALRNNCETAALSMMLAARGRRAEQLVLQRALPKDGPPDPRQGNDLPVWGDPDRGFVGRAEGGGTNGGYGVYEPPIMRLAQRYGTRFRRLSGDLGAVYRTLRAGRPVMAWVGLSDGPFMTWRSPEGRRITGNFGEHTVVLTGIAGADLTVNDPLSGKRLTWSRSYFEQLWKRLGRRAIG